MAIGITDAVDENRLALTVSQPVVSNYIHVDDFSQLESMMTQVLEDVCHPLPPPTTGNYIICIMFISYIWTFCIPQISIF